MNYESVLPAIDKLSESLSEDMSPDLACRFATRIAKAALQRDKESIAEAKRLFQELPRFMPPVQLGGIPGVEPFHTDKGFQEARQQGMMVFFEEFLSKLSGPTPPRELIPLAEQIASEIECNPLYGEKQSGNIAYKEGIQTAKNKIILFLNHLPSAFLT